MSLFIRLSAIVVFLGVLVFYQVSYAATYICTGFFVDSHGTIATANHCLKGAKKISVLVKGDDKLYHATILDRNEPYDAGLIKINKEGSLYVSLALFSPNRGDMVLELGIPDPDLQGYNIKGEVGMYLSTDSKGTNFYLIAHGGNSGSPILNRRGEVVSILTAGRSIPEMSGSIETFGVALRDLYNLLSNNNISSKTSLGSYTSFVDEFNSNVNKVVLLIIEE
jgi:S1-C subfamily serine protease